MTTALELLQRLGSSALPCTIDHPGEIVLLRALRATALVEADVPQSLTVGGLPFQRSATVRAVTPRGWEALFAAVSLLPHARPVAGRCEPWSPQAVSQQQSST